MPITTEISLYSLIREIRIPLSVEARLMIAYDIVTALATLHRDNITHQNLVPSNILIKNGRAILTNFSIRNLAVTMVGELCYLAPEIFKGDKFQLASDIYSFGRALHVLLDWQLPKQFRMETLSEYPLEIKNLVSDCTHSESQARPTALQLMTKINKLILGLFTPASASGAPSIYCGSTRILYSVFQEKDLLINPLIKLIAEYHSCREDGFNCINDEESKERERQIETIAFNKISPNRDEIWELAFQLLYSVKIGLAVSLCKLVLDYYDNLRIPENSSYKSLKSCATGISTLNPAYSNPPRVRNELYDNIGQARQKIFEYLCAHQLAKFFPEVEGSTINHEFLDLKPSYSEYSEWIREKLRLNPECPMVHQQNLAIIVYNLQKTKDNERPIYTGTVSVSASDLWNHRKNLTSSHEQKASAKAALGTGS